MAADSSTVTELACDEISHEQLERLCHRYYWAGTIVIVKMTSRPPVARDQL